jgi:6-phosphogluconolactonase
VGPPPGPPSPSHVYVGTGGGEIFSFTLDGGHLLSRAAISVGRGPVALAAGPGGRFVYAWAGGDLAALAVKSKGALAVVGRGSSRGSGPSELAVHRGGKYLLATNAGSGTTAVLPIKPDGTLGPGDTFTAGRRSPSAQRPRMGITPHPSAEVVFVADAPAARISQFVFNTGTGILTPSREPPLDLTPASAPGRIAIHPGGRFVYVLEEGLGSIAGYTFEPISGTLTVLSFQTVPIAERDPAAAPPARRRGKRPPPAPEGGDLQLDPQGRFLYAVDGAHDQIAVFAIDRESGGLTVVARTDLEAHHPVALAIADHGRVLLAAHQDPPGVTTFFTDEHNGTIVLAPKTSLKAAPRSLAVATEEKPR